MPPQGTAGGVVALMAMASLLADFLVREDYYACFLLFSTSYVLHAPLQFTPPVTRLLLLGAVYLS